MFYCYMDFLILPTKHQCFGHSKLIFLLDEEVGNEMEITRDWFRFIDSKSLEMLHSSHYQARSVII